MNNYEKYAAAIIGGLCTKSNPTITRTVDDRGVLLTISNIDRADMGLIIGREGTHVQAIRTLLRAVGKSENAHVSIRIEEPIVPIPKVDKDTDF